MNLRAANMFGAFGYIAILSQWLWMMVSLLSPVFNYEMVSDALFPDSGKATEQVAAVTVPEPIGMLFVGFAIVFSISITLYALVALPKAIGRSGRSVTHKGADIVLPHIIHHKKHQSVSKKRQKTILERLTWTFKLALIAIPLAALIIPVSPELGLEQAVVIGFGVVCAGVSIFWFTLQLLLAKAAGIPAEKLW